MQSGPSAQLDWSRTASGKQHSEDFDLESITAEEKTLRDHLADQLAAWLASPKLTG